MLLGLGLGGFVDGIVLHQILQWHHMLSAQEYAPTTTVAGLELNTLADGLFHLAAWACTLPGVILLWRSMRRGARSTPSFLAGGLLAGWGGFNLVEGVVDHHLLGIHHVRDDVSSPLPWDVDSRAASAVLVAAGIALARPATARRA